MFFKISTKKRPQKQPENRLIFGPFFDPFSEKLYCLSIKILVTKCKLLPDFGGFQSPPWLEGGFPDLGDLGWPKKEFFSDLLPTEIISAEIRRPNVFHARTG